MKLPHKEFEEFLKEHITQEDKGELACLSLRTDTIYAYKGQKITCAEHG